MAKYTRFDPRNKKRNKDKDNYFDRFSSSNKNRRSKELNEEEDFSIDTKRLYKKYTM